MQKCIRNIYSGDPSYSLIRSSLTGMLPQADEQGQTQVLCKYNNIKSIQNTLLLAVIIITCVIICLFVIVDLCSNENNEQRKKMNGEFFQGRNK